MFGNLMDMYSPPELEAVVEAISDLKDHFRGLS